MSDQQGSGPVHLTIDADVRVADPRRLGTASVEDLADRLADLIRRHAWEAGLELTDPQAVRVEVTPIA